MKAFEGGKFSASSKNAKEHPKITRSNSTGTKRPALGNLKDATSSEDEDGISRPHKALTDLFWEAKVSVRDYWVVKIQGDNVVSVLVQTISRHHKIQAIGEVNYAREQVMECAGRAQCQVNVRDAFPREKNGAGAGCINRGYRLYHLNKAGKIGLPH